jgi:hypothetical protein
MSNAVFNVSFVGEVSQTLEWIPVMTATLLGLLLPSGSSSQDSESSINFPLVFYFMGWVWGLNFNPQPKRKKGK